jgi:hypothetical protein
MIRASLFVSAMLLTAHSSWASDNPRINGNQQLTFPANENEMPTLDKNRDGYVSRTEANLIAALAMKFSMLDGNRDQKLDSKELSAFEASEMR